MAEPTKDDLLKEATAAGANVSESDSKAEIQEAIETARYAPPALGPVENEEGEVQGFERKGTPRTGIAPKTEADLQDLGELDAT